MYAIKQFIIIMYIYNNNVKYTYHLDFPTNIRGVLEPITNLTAVLLRHFPYDIDRGLAPLLIS